MSRADAIDMVRLAIINYKEISLEKAIRMSERIPYLAMFVAFRRRAKLVLCESNGLEEVHKIREMLVERTFQVLRKKDQSNADYYYITWPTRKDMWNIIRDAQQKYNNYLMVVSHLTKHSNLPNDLLEIILWESYNG